MINPPVWHASTVLFPTLDALDRAIQQPFDGMVYGLLGTPTSSAWPMLCPRNPASVR